MKLGTFLVIYTAVTVIWGISWLLLPGQLFALYGLQESTALKYAGQFFGAALIGLALFITETLCFLVALIGQLESVVNALGWSTVIICLLFTIGFGYFYYSERIEEKATTKAWPFTFGMG